MSEATNRQWTLAKRPEGLVDEHTFELREAAIPEPADGEFLVRLLMLSFDPTQRGWLNDVRGYVPPVQIGEVMRASGVGEVVASRHPGFSEGDLVVGGFGWQEWIATDGGGLLPARKLPPGVSPSNALSVFGTTGLTAYFGMLDVGKPRSGETVVVSGAAGATGSVAGQIAKIQGCRVVGIAGGPEKCAWLTDEAHFDAAVDYKNEDVGERLRALCPDRVDVYFDNVGGPTLDTLLLHLAIGARVAMCGGISSGYGTELPPGPRNIMQLVIQRARMEGFLVLDFAPRFGEAIAALAGWVGEGRIAFQEDIVEGFENAPQTLNRLFTGANRGKQLLRVADRS
ncbi:MAG: NADP-dependent oxidoreductase [Acidobacteria bacterium]|nr:MAG: NADP-dependent oxidoreductase [Acidobacteriota bacterium]REK00263.1 MAG: NADP-dependent oxidoreductase [Acidobacteriota bacterium]